MRMIVSRYGWRKPPPIASTPISPGSCPRSARSSSACARRSVRPCPPPRSAFRTIPTFRLHGKNLVHFAGWANHWALYPGSGKTVAEFADDLAGFEVSRGTIPLWPDPARPAAADRPHCQAPGARSDGRRRGRSARFAAHACKTHIVMETKDSTTPQAETPAAHAQTPGDPQVSHRDGAGAGINPLDPLGINAAAAEVYKAMLSRPDTLIQAQMDFAKQWMDVTTGMFAPKAERGSVIEPARNDARFKHPAWTENPIFAAMQAGLSARDEGRFGRRGAGAGRRSRDQRTRKIFRQAGLRRDEPDQFRVRSIRAVIEETFRTSGANFRRRAARHRRSARRTTAVRRSSTRVRSGREERRHHAGNGRLSATS